MIEELERFLNGNQYLKNHLDVFKEAFVKYYGESHRQEIEEKFSKAIFIGYHSPGSIEIYLSRISDAKSEKLKDTLLKDVEISLTKEDLFKNYSFDYFTIQPLYAYKKFLDLFFLEKDERQKKISEILPYFIKKEVEILFQKINPNIQIDNFSEYLKDSEIRKLNHILEKYPKAIEEYNAFMKKYSQYQNQENDRKNLQKNLQDKYYRQLILENIDLIPNDKRNVLKEYLDGLKNWHDLDEYIRYLFGNNLESDKPLMYFFTDAEDILKQENEPSWKKDIIKRERMNYFKHHNIDLGFDYDVYLQNEEVQKKWPSPEVVEKFSNSVLKVTKRYEKNYFSNIPENKKIQEEIDAKNFLGAVDLWNSKQTYVTPNIIKKGNDYELCSIVFINCDDFKSEEDHNIVHELNHLLELHLQEVNESSFKVYCGWELLTEDIKEKDRQVEKITFSTNKRPYELFNEVINELIAQDICKIVDKEDIYVFNNKQSALIKNVTSYECSKFLVNDFYQEYKDKILESRRNGNMEVIWNEVGKENFDALNDLFSIYNENLSGFKYYKLIDSLNSRTDSKEVRVYNELVAKKNAIMNNMRLYNSQHKSINGDIKKENR